MFRRETSFAAGRPLAPEVPSITVPQLIRHRARERADKVALVEAASGRRYTYGELDHLIGRFAAGLAALGFRPGERLVMFMPNLPEWPIAALGTMSAGGTVSGANSMSTRSELAYQLRDANARFVVTVPDFLSKVLDAASESHEIKIILLGEAPQTLSFSSMLTCQDPEPSIAPGPDTMAALPYSSGTSGLPKGVVLTHRNIVSNVFQFSQAAVWPESAVSLAFLPMYHIYGLTVVLLGGLVAGLQLVTVPRFEPEPFLKALQDYHVTHLAVVPPVLHFLTTHPLVDVSSGVCQAKFGSEVLRRSRAT
jgi:acyl-CoA synthetase (AMP-forming)/AMP-acid ligase II